MNILVLDVGTSNMRGILFNDRGEKIASAQQKYSVTCKADGWVEQNAEDWDQAMFLILKQIGELSAQFGWSVDAIALTSQRSSVIAVNREMEPLQPAIMWQDKRTMDICRKMSEYNDLFLSLGGVRINSVFTAPKMLWIRENQPDIYEKTWKFIVIPDYLFWKLTGKLKTDVTYGSRSLLMNLHQLSWDEELLDLFHIERSKLCDLVPSGSILGTLQESYARKIGLKSGIPVITAGGDQQCGAIGQGVFEKGKVALTAGTGGFIVAATDEFPDHLDESGVTCNCSSLQGQYILEDTMLTCCSAFDWFCKTFYPEEGLEKINEIIEQVPAGANDVLCLPYFLGRGTPDWNDAARGLFANISLNTRKEDFLRALMESISYEFTNGIGLIQKHVRVGEVFVNGGLSNSKVFDQILCDTLGLFVTKIGKSDATACGAFLVALKAMDPMTDLSKAFAEMHHPQDRVCFVPDDARKQQYRKQQEEMNGWYTRNYAGAESL